MASSLLVNPFTKTNGEPASSSLYRFSVHCLYQDFVKSCVFFYFFHQRIEVFHDLFPLSCRSYEMPPISSGFPVVLVRTPNVSLLLPLR